MVKLILLPKFDPSCLKRIAADQVCRTMLPDQPVVRVFICQDGRAQQDQAAYLEFEQAYFEMLYQDRNKLNRRNTKLQFREFSFAGSLDTLQEHLRELKTCDIFYMTGFSIGQGLSVTLMNVFQNHARLGHDERIQSDIVENLFRAIVNRVQYNQMLYMGVCGGAMCAGNSLRHSSAPEFGLFDFLMGVSLEHDAGLQPHKCHIQVINHKTFKITGGAGLAVHIEDDIADASSFQAGVGGKWQEWCRIATLAHQRAVHQITIHSCTGPWYYPSVGVWWLKLNGWFIYSIVQPVVSA